MHMRGVPVCLMSERARLSTDRICKGPALASMAGRQAKARSWLDRVGSILLAEGHTPTHPAQDNERSEAYQSRGHEVLWDSLA